MDSGEAIARGRVVYYAYWRTSRQKQGCACGHGTAPKNGRDGPQVRDSMIKHSTLLLDDNEQGYGKAFEVQLNVKNGI